MTGPAPAVARTRNAVRDALAGLDRGATVLVACSGGADSLALAHALAFVAPRLGLIGGLVTVDHGLQEGSERRAADVAALGRRLGFAIGTAVTAAVGRVGGPEAAARSARYAALDAARREHGAALVLLGHTMDDQAETVLLGMARGSGPRGLAGMRRRRGAYARPFLDLPRADTVAACAALGAEPWDDPHNVDPAYTRSRVRAAMPTLVDVLGARLPANLARTARLVAEDADALDEIAAAVLTAALDADRDGGSLPVESVAARPRAVRARVLHRWAVTAGADDAELGFVHIDAMDALVSRWRGQGPVFLPGGVTVRRSGPFLLAVPTVRERRTGPSDDDGRAA